MKIILCWFLVSLVFASPLLLRAWLQGRRTRAAQKANDWAAWWLSVEQLKAREIQEMDRAEADREGRWRR